MFLRAGPAELGRNVCQPDRVLADQIVGHETKRRHGAREEWLAVTKNDRMQVELIRIDETKPAQALRKLRTANFNLSSELGFQSAYHCLDIVGDNPRHVIDKLVETAGKPRTDRYSASKGIAGPAPRPGRLLRRAASA